MNNKDNKTEFQTLNREESKMTKYNGWTNWDTWATKLWLDNDSKWLKLVYLDLGKNVYFNEAITDDNKQKQGVLRVKGLISVVASLFPKDFGLMKEFEGKELTRINFDEIVEAYFEELESYSSFDELRASTKSWGMTSVTVEKNGSYTTAKLSSARLFTMVDSVVDFAEKFNDDENFDVMWTALHPSRQVSYYNRKLTN